MTTFNGCTAKEFWSLGTTQRLQLLQTLYKGVMDYMVEDEYDSLPYGVKSRIDALLTALETNRLAKW